MQKRGRKAQAAMEFLMTYGWAILIVLVALSALYFLGVFNPNTPNVCNIKAPFFCKDIVIREEGFEIILGASNIGNGNVINISSNGQNCSKVIINRIQNGQPGSEIKNGDNNIRCYGANIKKNDKVNVNVDINYKTSISELTHPIKLNAVGSAEKSSYIYNFDDNAYFSFDFDNDNNINAIDYSYYKNDGTLNGVDLEAIDCIFGKCYNFDGINDHIAILNSANLENIQESSYTLAAWFKPTNAPPGNNNNDVVYGIVMKPGYHEGLIYHKNKQFSLEHWLVGDTWAGSYTGTTYEPGVYYYITGVMDKPAGKTKIYVNGVLNHVTSWTPNTATREFGAGNWNIGIGNPGASGWRFAANGKIDDVRIYNKALTDSEVKELYDSSKK